MNARTLSRHLRRDALALAVLLVLGAAPAWAQSHDHAKHARTTPQTPPAEDRERPSANTDHAGMNHGDMDHAGMDHSKMNHAGMDHSKTVDAASEPVTPIPPITDADRAAASRPLKHHMSHGSGIHQFHRVDRLETWNAEEGAGLHWEAEGWIGTDTDRLWLRSEGEREDGRTQAADLELLYGRSVSPWWDVVAGVRHEVRPGDGRTFAAVGIMGLAPQKFEVEATLYAAGDGQTAFVVEAERELLLTNRLILQPMIEAGFNGRTEHARGIGAGLGDIEIGLRLRYEITRRFAPYIGVVHERAFGETADLRRRHGERADETRVVAGIRFWF